LLGLLSAGWATTRNVPAPNGTDDTANIQNTITGASSGDTILFSASGSYKVSSPLTFKGSLTYNGNTCSLNWIATTVNYMIEIPNGTNSISMYGFTFNGSAYGGGIEIGTSASSCSGISIYSNTMENNTYTGGTWGMNSCIYGVGLTGSSITENTFSNSTQGILIYEPTTTSITYNTFQNIYGDCVSLPMQDNFLSQNMVISNNTMTNNCQRLCIEVINNTDGNLFDSENLQIESNTISATPYFDSTDGWQQEDISVVNHGENTTISNNNCTFASENYSTAAIEFYPGNSSYFANADGRITNNIVDNTPWAFCWESSNSGSSIDHNLFVNEADCNGGIGYLFDEPTGNSCGGSADVYTNNWAYQCVSDLTHYPNNYNLSGSCPTVSITGAQNGANGIFTITSSIAVGQNTAVTYAVSGTGIPGTDYTALSGTATILSGQTSVTVPVTHLPSNHGNVTVIATLTLGPYYSNYAATSATVTINTNSIPTVTVAASPTSINEKGGTSTYTVTRTGATTSALVVNYAMSGTATSGTDYTALSGSLTIASGSTTGTVTLTAKDRYLLSGSKTAILTISSNANYTVGSPSSVTVTINDNDSNPISTTNLMLWLRADVGVTKNGSNRVSSWADQSGKSMTATGQGTTDPLWVNNALNSYPAMQFDGVSNYFSLPSGFANFTAGTTIFVVATQTVTTNNAHFVDFSAGFAVDVMSLLMSTTSNDLAYWEYNGSWSGLTDSNALTLGTPYLTEFVEASSGSATLYVNATAQTTATIVIPTNVTRTGNFIAKSDSTADALFEGNIEEVIVYNTALSTANRQAVESYLRAKYATW
jgi:hypothetical protein